jgi:hypothetical protein
MECKYLESVWEFMSANTFYGNLKTKTLALQGQGLIGDDIVISVSSDTFVMSKGTSNLMTVSTSNVTFAGRNIAITSGSSGSTQGLMGVYTAVHDSYVTSNSTKIPWEFNHGDMIPGISITDATTFMYTGNVAFIMIGLVQAFSASTGAQVSGTSKVIMHVSQTRGTTVQVASMVMYIMEMRQICITNNTSIWFTSAIDDRYYNGTTLVISPVSITTNTYV